MDRSSAATDLGTVFAVSTDSQGEPMETVKLLGDHDAVMAVILLRDTLRELTKPKYGVATTEVALKALESK